MRKLTEWQADDTLPDDWLRVLGAARTYAQRSQFFFGFFKTVAIALLSYSTVQGYALTASLPLIGQFTLPFGEWLWPTMSAWVVVVFLAGGFFVLIDRVGLHPAQIMYNQAQNGKENRSPNYRETMETKRKVEALHEKVDRLAEKQNTPRADGGTAVVPECRRCGEAGVGGEHKGQDVIECPECDDILFREVNRR